jgi:tetratricopeptide (TPR) repeat protein
MCPSLRYLLASFAPLLIAASVVADGDWTGKTVILRGGKTVKLSRTDQAGNKVEVGDLKWLAYHIVKEENGWLQVQQHDVVGWFPKADAVVLEEAVALFTQQILANPNDAEAFARRATAWQRKGDVDNALKDYSEALRLNPTAAAWWSNRGIGWYAKKDYDKSIKDFDEAIRINPKMDAYYYGRGLSWAAKKEYDKAIKDYDEALRLEPKYVHAYGARGNAWLAKKNHARAIKDFDEAIRLDANYSNAYSRRGSAWSAKKEYAKAIKDYDEVIRLEPKSEPAYNDLAWLLATCSDAKVRDGPRAVQLATKACELTDWKNSNPLDTLAAAYAEAGQYDHAVHWQHKALEDPYLKGSAGDEFRQRLELYKQKRPYREGP